MAEATCAAVVAVPTRTICPVERERIASFSSAGGFAMIKVVAIVLFILFGVALLAGVRHANVPGAAGYADFAPHGVGGVWLAVVMVMFSYLGTEIVAVTSGEARDPARSLLQSNDVTGVLLSSIHSMG